MRDMPGICETTEYEACVYRHEFIERKGITMDKMKMDEMELDIERGRAEELERGNHQ